MAKPFIVLALMGFTVSVQAFPCFVTIIKDSCWKEYNVTVDVLDASNANANLATVIVPTGSAWARQQFTCTPGMKLKFQAQFTPVFWQADAGRVYQGQHYWILPSKIKNDETAWSLTLCYPRQFSEVPFPPTAGSRCECNVKDIPPVPPQ